MEERSQKHKHCGRWHAAPEDKCWEHLSKKANDEAKKNATQVRKDLKRKRFDDAIIKKAKEFAHAMPEKESQKTGDEFAQHCCAMSIDEFGCTNSADDDSTDNFFDGCCFAFQDSVCPGKRQRISKAENDCTVEIITEIPDWNGKSVPICALRDLGTTKSIVLHDCVQKGRTKSFKGEHMTRAMTGGTFSTNQKALLDFKFPELGENKAVTWIFHADSVAPKEKSSHDMTTGMELLTQMDVCVNAEDKQIHWEGDTTLLKHQGEIST